MPPAIVFDLIGVLAEPSWRELAPAAARAAWGAVKRGTCPEGQLWPAPSALAYRRLLALRPDRAQLLERLHAGGHRLLVASNLYARWADHLRASPGPLRRVDAWLFSSQLGVAKPEPAFFARLLEHVPRGSLFIDDTAANCEAAAAAGLAALWAWPGRDLEGAIDRALAAPCGAPTS